MLFTGATASVRGNVLTASFAAGKFALRALSQSLAKEFGKQNIHVAHAIIDGGILTQKRTEEQIKNTEDKLTPEGIAKVSRMTQENPIMAHRMNLGVPVSGSPGQKQLDLGIRL